MVTKLFEAADKMFVANPKNKIAVAALFATPADSILQPREQLNHLKSQLNAVLRQIKVINVMESTT